MSTEEIVPVPLDVPAPVDVPTIPTPALPLDLMPIAPWITADHLQEPLEAPVPAEETLDAHRARIQLGKRLGALSGRDWIHVGLAALLAGLLVFGAGIYAVRQGRHIASANATIADVTAERTAETKRADGLTADLTSTRTDLSNTKSLLGAAQSDRDAYKSRVTSAEAAAVSAQNQVTTVAAHEETRRLACGEALTLMNSDWSTFAQAVVRGASPSTATSPALKDAMNRCLNKSALGV